MDRSRVVLTRIAITLAVIDGVLFAFKLSDYPFDFARTWAYRHMMLEAIGMTLAVTAAAYVIGMPLGIVVALARMSRWLPVRHLGDMYVELIRGTPFIVQLSLAYFGVADILGIKNRFAVGVVALGMFAAAYAGEIFRAGIESVERGQVEAARSLGLSRWQAMRHVVLPQALKRMIPPLTGELIALTKESSLLFAIGIVEILAVARQMGANTYAYLEAYVVAAGCYLLLTIPLSFLARRLERKLGTAQPAGDHL